MRSHHHSVDGTFAQEGEDLVSGEAGANDDLAKDSCLLCLARQRFEAFHFGAGSGSVIVVANS